MNTIFRTQLSIALPLLLCYGSVQAGFVNPAWERGIEGSAYLQWESFVKPPGATNSVNTLPDVGSINIGSSVLTEHIGAAFVTGTGNLYTFNSMSDYTLVVTTDDNGPSPIAQDVQVQLQISTWSRTIKDADITLNGVTGEITEVGEDGFTTPNWDTPFTRYLYNASWNVAATGVYKFAWLLDQTSTSLDAVMLDMYSSGEISGLLVHALMPILPAIPGSTFFDGITQFNADDFIGNGIAASHYATVVPLPAAAPLLLSGLLWLGLLARKRKVVTSA